MAMFDDPKKELAKLEAQLLKDEEWFDTELEMAKALIGDEPAPKKPAKQAAPAQASGKTAGKTKKEAPAPKKSNKGLVILACLETLGIVGVVAYWMLFLL